MLWLIFKLGAGIVRQMVGLANGFDCYLTWGLGFGYCDLKLRCTSQEEVEGQ